MNCTILQGDALELLRTLPPESVHTCVTSPPYDDAFRGGSRALNAAMERTPLVLELHYADMIATQREKHEEGL